MAKRQHISEPQTAAVGHKNPGWKQNLPSTFLGSARHFLGCRDQSAYLFMAPRTGQRTRALDTANLACTIVHQQVASEGSTAEGDQHPPVILNRLWSKAMESLSQVAVDVGNGQFTDLPRQSFGQDAKLFRVPGGSPGLHGVVKGEVVKQHGKAPQWWQVFFPMTEVFSTPLQSSYNPNMFTGTPSSIVYGTLRSALVWCVLRDHRILRLAFLAALTTALWLNRLGLVCTLLVLGHLGEAIKELCPKDGD